MLLASVLAFGACKSPDLGFAIAVTVRFDDSVDAAQRALVTSLRVTSSGDEQGQYDEPLPKGTSDEERFVYRPGANARAIELALAARSATATIAEGASGQLSLSAGETTAVEIWLRAPGSGDGGVGDGGTGDASGPVSMLAFEHAARYTGCLGARESAVADFDGDGRPDVALVCNTSATMQVYFSQADASFPTTPSAITTVLAPTGLAAVDFDADTHLDLIVVSSDGVHLLKNDGTGKFADVATRALTGATTVSVADFDKDGSGDLLVSGSPTEIRVMWGTGVATSAFSTSATLTMALPPLLAKAVDLDNDGYLDVFTSELQNQGKVESFHNNQASMARSFVNQMSLDYSTVFSGVFQDINNDGKPEGLFGVGCCGTYGTFLWSNNNGMLAQTSESALARKDLQPIDMLLVDIDHDTVDDLVMVVRPGYVVTYKGIGPFQFDVSPRPAYWVGGNAGRMHAADIDKDGFEDLVLIDGDGFAVARGAAGAKLHASEVFMLDTPSPPAIGDFDKDGDQDIAVTYGMGSAVAFANDGKGNMTAGPVLPTMAVGCSYGTAVAEGDVNNDGVRDVVRAAMFCYDSLFGMAGGNLTGGPSGALDTTAIINRVALADLDEDGKLDLVWYVTASSVPPHLKVSLGIGDGSFAAPSTDVVPTDPRVLKLADVNMDGHIDILLSSEVDNKVSMYLNDGKAVFAAPITVQGPSNLRAMEVFDYDEDGVLDLVLAGATIYQFKGGPGFSDAQHSSRSLVSPWQRMAVGDVNRDGHLDLVGASSAGIEVLTGTGTAAFTPAHAFSFPSPVTAVDLADLDGDKLPELVIVGPRPGAAILRNLSR